MGIIVDYNDIELSNQKMDETKHTDIDNISEDHESGIKINHFRSILIAFVMFLLFLIECNLALK